MDENMTEEDNIAFIKIYAPEYYLAEYDEALHCHQLPLPFQSLAQANPFLFPTKAQNTIEVMQRLRLRLAVAPSTRVNFSSKKMLQILGFSPEARVQRKFPFENTDMGGYKFFVADTFPSLLEK